MSSEPRKARDELQRLRRLVDQQVTAHSNMAGSMASAQRIKDITIFAFSILLAATVFVDPAILSLFFANDMSSRLALGVVSLTIFFLSSLSLFLGWTRKAVEHESTSTELFEIEQMIREELAREKFDDDRATLIKKRYDLVNTKAPKLNDKQFLKAKAKHLKKVRLSKMLDRKPHASVICLRFRFWIHDNFYNWAEKHEN